MRKNSLFFLSICVLISCSLSLTSCGFIEKMIPSELNEQLKFWEVTEKGIENFHVSISTIGVTRCLFPSNFLELYPYTEGDFDYYDKSTLKYSYETALLYMIYDDTSYEQAKQYALEHSPIESKAENFGSFVFFRQIHKDAAGGDKLRFYIAYSDEKNMLLAVGTYMSGSNVYTYASVEEYMSTYFPFFDIECATIQRE